MTLRPLKWVAAAVLLVILAGFSAYLTLYLLIGKEQRVVVPDLTGDELLAALERLSSMDLDTRVAGSEFSDTLPRNHVIHHMPPAGTEIKAGRAVRLVISKGAEQVLVPNLVGLSLEAARAMLRQRGLCPGHTAEVFDRMRPAGRIKAQQPAAHSPVTRAQCVDLLVSRGPRPQHRAMPALIGRHISEVSNKIAAAGLRAGSVTHRWDPTRPPDTVIIQHPPAGTRVETGITVDLMLNRSPDAPEIALKSDDSSLVRLVRHRAAMGLRDRHLRITLENDVIEQAIFDEMVTPGREVWLLVPDWQGARVMVYEDQALMAVR